MCFAFCLAVAAVGYFKASRCTINPFLPYEKAQ